MAANLSNRVPLPLSSVQWQAGGASVRGAGHVKDGTPNQDAISIWRESGEGHRGRAIVAVADGHGSPTCFRSARGSAMAVESAIVVLRKMLLERADASPIETLAPTLRQWVCSLWRLGAERHLAANPFTDKELDDAAADADAESMGLLNRNPLVAYGSTLLVACATATHLIYLQLGDGDVLAIDPDGAARRPVTAGEGTFGDATHSLCGQDAWKDMACVVERLDVLPTRSVLIATDGYSNSYGDDSTFLQVGADMGRRIAQSGLTAVNGQLPKWLDHITSNGSGDDITVGLLARSDTPPPAA